MRRALEKEPKDRFGSAREMIEALEGRLFHGATGSPRIVQSVLLRRLANYPQHAYLWVPRLAVIGPESGAALEVCPALP